MATFNRSTPEAPRGSIAARLFIAIAATVVPACSPPSDRREGGSEEVVYDFAASLDIAEIRPQTRRIELGARHAWHHLLDGWWSGIWAMPETTPDAVAQVWGTGERSALRFYSYSTKELEIEVRCQPRRSRDGRPQSLKVRINDTPLTTLPLHAETRSYSIPIPAHRLRAGENLLEFVYSTLASELVYSDPVHRANELNVRYEFIRITDGEPPERPAAEIGGGRPLLHLPSATEVAYYLDAPAGAHLVVEGLHPYRTRQGRSRTGLEVRIRTQESDHDAVHQLHGSGIEDNWRLPLPDSGGIMRIAFRAEIAEKPTAGAGVTLAAPHLVAATDTRPLPTLQGVQVNRQGPANESIAPVNVVLFLIDALRADRLGVYGYSRPVSPNIDAFADGSVLFRRAFAQAPWTKSSVSSMFTGQYPPMHGVTRIEHSLSEHAKTLAEVLSENGYQTAGFSSNVNVSSSFGLTQGFQTFRLTRTDDVIPEAESWLLTRERERPFFLFLHFVDPHDPYRPPPDLRRRFAPGVSADAVDAVPDVRAALAKDPNLTRESIARDFQALYDAEIAHADAALGRLIEILRSQHLLDASLVLLTSDHGEEFLEHGRFAHGLSLYDEILHIPLLIRFPSSDPGGLDTEVTAQHVDLLPTVLDFLGIASPAAVQGESLIRLLADGESGRDRWALSFSDREDRDLQSILVDNLKLIRSYPIEGQPSRIELFDHKEDPGEQTSLTTDHPVTAGYLETLLRSWLQAQRFALDPDEVILDETTRQRLRALGYIQ